MHHVVLERWSRGQSWLHSRDSRAKLAGALLFLVLIATAPPGSWLLYGAAAVVLGVATLAARLPLTGVLRRAALALPFGIFFALTSWFSGDTVRASSLIAKTFLSAWTALWLAACTPIADLLLAARSFGVPRLLLLVVQFLYRYLFVLSEQGQHMRLAAACRAGNGGGLRPLMTRAASGALAVLFARSYQRANGIHQAMQSRGFTGTFPALASHPFGWRDGVFLVLAAAPLVAVRVLE